MENAQFNHQHDEITPADDTGLNLKKFIYTFWDYWPWFAASSFLCVLVAFLYLRYATPVYRINSKILIKDEKSGPSGSSEDILSQLDIFNTQNNVNDEMQVLQTYFLMRKVVDKLQLNISYFIVGNLKSTELYKNSPFKIQIISLKDSIEPQKFKIKFLETNSGFTVENDSIDKKYNFNDTVKTRIVSFRVIPNNNIINLKEDYQVNISTPAAAAENYLRATSFNITDKMANVIEITLQSTVPQKGEDILNKLYEVYTRVNEEDKNKTADSTINFIDERLAVVSGELSGVEKNIEDFKVKNQLSTDLTEQSRLVLNSASDIRQQLTTQDVQINVVQSIEEHLQGSGQRIVPNAGVIEDPTYITTVQQYNALVLERDRQLQTTKPDNPLIQNLNNQIEGVKKSLLISLENIKREMQISRDELQRKNDEALREIKSSPSIERAFLDISRQQDVKQQLYLYLLQKREETAISKSGTLANSRLIEPAKSDALPFSPQRPLVYLIALFFGVLLPTAILYLKNLLNNTVTNSLDLAKEIAIPVLGELGHNSTRKTIVAEANSRTALAEQFRALRTNLQFLLKGKEQQVIMITSSTSGEGKSFLTTNLGASLALTNKKVVLIELDLRKPKLSKQLNINNEKGFTNYIISNCTKEELLMPTYIHPNLFLISSGAIPPNPAELLLDPKTEELFSWLRARFDYIIIDTPPAGLVIDAVIIAKHTDASVYVVRQGYTLKDQLKLVNSFHEQEKISNLSVLINDVKPKRTYGYRYHYGYGYGNGYASDYYSDAKKPKRNLFRKAKKY
ncbi:MAG TPA: polysaccharide biosynthesis tyrosine autokinase [Parafilimonas sp.]|nr:polysaccharide biosynthesis tyrosine autokinase [Parafilimonas sp.]